MPINSYMTPPPSTTSTESGTVERTHAAPGIQRLNSAASAGSGSHQHQQQQQQQQQAAQNDRRRRGSSFGNLFSNLASSLRQQSSATHLPTSAQGNASPMSVSPSTPAAPQAPPSLSHQASTATMRPSLHEHRANSAGNAHSSSQSLSLAMSPTMADLTGTMANTSIQNSSESSLIRVSQDDTERRDSRDLMAHGALAEADETETGEDNLEHARTRHNSTAVVQTLAETSADKREPDGSFSLRLTPFIDHSSSSPALYFSPLIRKLRPGVKLPIGRYTERNREAAQAPQGSSAAVVFKSKVVSRTHAEILVDEHGNWYIKDLKSSSGTFLNHIRLSPAGQESDDCMINDGDILQLGMDFRGGSEEIFRCVKVRIELNKSWKRKTHKFNRDAHKKMLGEDTECCICLNDLRVGDSIFISPCSHSWHYKCIRPLLVRNYPQFHCPNCRCITDLEEDDDDDDEES